MQFVLLVGYMGTRAATVMLNADPGVQYVFGERGWGTRACEDIGSSSWEYEPHHEEMKIGNNKWFVTTAGGQYECGDCSIGCEGKYSKYKVGYNLSGVDKCPTRFLNEVDKSPLYCNAVPKRNENGEPYKRTMNIAAYGSSHTRVLYFHIWRLLAGKRWPEPLPEEMVSAQAGGTGAPAGGHQNSSFDFCNGRLRLNIVFHFKRFFLSTASDNHFLQVLGELNMTDLDLLVTEESVWSRFEAELRPGESRREICEKVGIWCQLYTQDPQRCQGFADCAEGWNMTMASEEHYFLDWLVQHFGSKKVDTIIAVGSGESPDKKLAETADFMTRIAAESAKHSKWKACVLDRRILGRPPAGMVCAHGCDGPAPAIQAQAILRSINSVLEYKHQSGEF